MAYLDVILRDQDGFDIVTDAVDGMAAAKIRARYLLTEEYAARLGTSHATLGTHKVEVRNADGTCLFDAFLQ